MGGKRPRRKFSDEFKRDAVEIVRSSGRPIRQVASELGIYDSTLGNWVRQDEINRGEREGLTSDERERLRALERENARLRMERELEKTSCGLLGEGVERVTLQLLRRYPEGRRVPGKAHLFGDRRVTVCVLRLSEATRCQPGAAGRGCPGRRDPGNLVRVGGDIRFAPGVRRATPPRPGGEPQTGGTVDETPRYRGFCAPKEACHHHRGQHSSDP